MRVLLVCLGNICRSPMAEGALRARLAASPLAGMVEVDSAGTSDWHVGRPPDPRAVRTARANGVDIAGLRARELVRADFSRFDWILCADAHNLRDALALAPAAERHRVALWLEWAHGPGAAGQSVPDPYQGDEAGFARVWTLIDAAARASVARLVQGANSGIMPP